jgi:hypothetical protein
MSLTRATFALLEIIARLLFRSICFFCFRHRFLNIIQLLKMNDVNITLFRKGLVETDSDDLWTLQKY